MGAARRAPDPHSRTFGRLARWAGVALGSSLMVPGLYGLIYLGMVLEQWQMCQADTAVAFLGTSYPAGFCQTRDWIAALVPGIGMLAVAVVGVVMLAASIRATGHPAR